jgi:hypothetical protein
MSRPTTPTANHPTVAKEITNHIFPRGDYRMRRNTGNKFWTTLEDGSTLTRESLAHPSPLIALQPSKLSREAAFSIKGLAARKAVQLTHKPSIASHVASFTDEIMTPVTPTREGLRGRQESESSVYSAHPKPQPAIKDVRDIPIISNTDIYPRDSGYGEDEVSPRTHPPIPPRPRRHRSMPLKSSYVLPETARVSPLLDDAPYRRRSSAVSPIPVNKGWAEFRDGSEERSSGEERKGSNTTLFPRYNYKIPALSRKADAKEKSKAKTKTKDNVDRGDSRERSAARTAAPVQDTRSRDTAAHSNRFATKKETLGSRVWRRAGEIYNSGPEGEGQKAWRSVQIVLEQKRLGKERREQEEANRRNLEKVEALEKLRLEVEDIMKPYKAAADASRVEARAKAYTQPRSPPPPTPSPAKSLDVKGVARRISLPVETATRKSFGKGKGEASDDLDVTRKFSDASSTTGQIVLLTASKSVLERSPNVVFKHGSKHGSKYSSQYGSKYSFEKDLSRHYRKDSPKVKANLIDYPRRVLPPVPMLVRAPRSRGHMGSRMASWENKELPPPPTDPRQGGSDMIRAGIKTTAPSKGYPDPVKCLPPPPTDTRLGGSDIARAGTKTTAPAPEPYNWYQGDKGLPPPREPLAPRKPPVKPSEHLPKQVVPVRHDRIVQQEMHWPPPEPSRRNSLVKPVGSVPHSPITQQKKHWLAGLDDRHAERSRKDGKNKVTKTEDKPWLSQALQDLVEQKAHKKQELLKASISKPYPTACPNGSTANFATESGGVGGPNAAISLLPGITRKSELDKYRINKKKGKGKEKAKVLPPPQTEYPPHPAVAPLTVPNGPSVVDAKAKKEHKAPSFWNDLFTKSDQKLDQKPVPTRKRADSDLSFSCQGIDGFAQRDFAYYDAAANHRDLYTSRPTRARPPPPPPPPHRDKGPLRRVGLGIHGAGYDAALVPEPLRTAGSKRKTDTSKWDEWDAREWVGRDTKEWSAFYNNVLSDYDLGEYEQSKYEG